MSYVIIEKFIDGANDEFGTQFVSDLIRYDSGGWKLVGPKNLIGDNYTNPSLISVKPVFTYPIDVGEKLYYDDPDVNKIIHSIINSSFESHDPLKFLLLRSIRAEYLPMSLDYGVKTNERNFLPEKKQNTYAYILPIIETDAKLLLDGEEIDLEFNKLVVFPAEKEYHTVYGPTKMTFLLTGTFISNEEL